jgi:thioredoxin reductase
MTVSQKQQLAVMIVGAGFGGLMLALLLEMAKVEYHVYEKAAFSSSLSHIISYIPFFGHATTLRLTCPFPR